MKKLTHLFCSALLILAAGTTLAQTNRLFVTNEADNTVSVVNAASLEVEATIAVGNRPRGIGFSPDHLAQGGAGCARTSSSTRG